MSIRPLRITERVLDRANAKGPQHFQFYFLDYRL